MKTNRSTLVEIIGLTLLSGCNAQTLQSSNSLGSLASVNVSQAQAPCQAANLPFGGGDGSISAPYQICSTAQLSYLSSYTASHFILTSDLDLGGTGAVHIPGAFTGSFDGQGYTISHFLASNWLIQFNQGTIQNLKLSNVSISSTYFVYENDGTISNVSLKNAGIITNLNASTGLVSHSSATSTFASISLIGGLVAENDGIIRSSFSTIPLSSASSGAMMGGLIGIQTVNAQVIDSYATGQVTSTNGYAGGLIGQTNSRSYVTNCFAVGQASGNVAMPLVGLATGTASVISGAYYDTLVGSGGIGTGLSPAQLKIQSNFSGFDFSNTWTMGTSFPTLL